MTDSLCRKLKLRTLLNPVVWAVHIWFSHNVTITITINFEIENIGIKLSHLLLIWHNSEKNM